MAARFENLGPDQKWQIARGPVQVMQETAATAAELSKQLHAMIQIGLDVPKMT